MQTVKKSIDYKKIYQGKKIYTKAFCLHFIKTSQDNAPPQFGFTVSKKTVSKKAVIRNLIRRRLKSCIREYFDHEQFYGYQFVLTAIKSTKSALWADYVRSVEDVQKRLLQLSDGKNVRMFNDK